MVTTLAGQIKKINLTEDLGGGLINDPAAAARNRQNIERMRTKESDTSRAYEAGYRSEHREKILLTKQVKEIKQENITQEVIKVMPVGVPVPQDELEKQKDAIIADAAKLNQVQLLRKYKIGCARWAELRKKWGVKDKKRGGNHHRNKVETNEPKAYDVKMVINVDAEVATEKMRYLLNAKARLEEPIRIYGVTFPAFNESWSDPVKLAWFSAFSNLR